MSLATELATQRETSLRNAPQFAPIVDRLVAELRQHETGGNAPKVGDAAPLFSLPDVRGQSVALATRLGSGPVILIFYRGGWCPYCNLELRAYQRELDRIRQLGATLVAISPQTPDASLTTAEKNAVTFDVLSDVGSVVAGAYGLAFALPDYVRDLYRERKIPLVESNGVEDWTLPIPGTFLIDRDARVVLSHVDVEYRTRLDPETVLDALSTLVRP